jgi:UDP:flavonoid glycosyltransferase YjiC (YdhE family)
MRILFTFVGGRGHFEPLVPIARAAAAAGHEVAFGCGPSRIAMVGVANFVAYAMGEDSGSPPARRPLRAVDGEREVREFRDRFARRAARSRVPLVMALCAEWRPDVLVCDETDFGAMVAGERLGLPFATVLVLAAGSFVRTEVIGNALAELRAEHDLRSDPDLDMLSRYLVLSPFPPSFRDPAYPLPATAHCFRPVMLASEEDALMAGRSITPNSQPTWSSVLPRAATIYLTLGTVFNLESGDLFARVLAALRELPANLVATVGGDIDPAEFGPQPAHVFVEQYIPQSLVLPHCDVVVSHAGSGSVLGALAHGVPSVLIPLGADQPQNANRCEQLGVALVLDALEVTPSGVQNAVSSVLDDPAYRGNAQQLRGEIELLPEPAYAVTLLERLVVNERSPGSM